MIVKAVVLALISVAVAASFHNDSAAQDLVRGRTRGYPGQGARPLQPVLVVSEARSGSTLIGEMFNRAPGSFYVYEPCRSLEGHQGLITYSGAIFETLSRPVASVAPDCSFLFQEPGMTSAAVGPSWSASLRVPSLKLISRLCSRTHPPWSDLPSFARFCGRATETGALKPISSTLKRGGCARAPVLWPPKRCGRYIPASCPPPWSLALL